MANNIVEATDSTFQREVLQAEGPVLVDFWAPWCGPCRALGPVLEQLAEENRGRAKFVKVNVDQNPQVAQTYHIQGIPALFFFVNGVRAGELVGLQPREAIQRKLSELQGMASSQDSNGLVVMECPSCGQKNRTPHQRLSEAVCGRCHQRLRMNG